MLGGHAGPVVLLFWFLGSPGDQAIHCTAAVGILDPVVIDTEAAATWCTDLVQRESSGGSGSPATLPDPNPQINCDLGSSPAHPT